MRDSEKAPTSQCIQLCNEKAARAFEKAMPSQISSLGEKDQACRADCVVGNVAEKIAKSQGKASAKAGGQVHPEEAYWISNRSRTDADLKLPYQRRPFWVISVSAGGRKAGTRKAVEKRRAKGLDGHMAWLGESPSANRKELWLVYVGPYEIDDIDALKVKLQEVRSTVSKSAYAVTLGDAGERRQLK
jgi:hypothetical protein